MMLSNLFTSALRTYVPIVIGSVLAWLAVHFGIAVDNGTEAALAIPLTGFLIAAYWSLVRLIERKFPQAGVLLGSATQPTYRKAPQPVAGADLHG